MASFDCLKTLKDRMAWVKCLGTGTKPTKPVTPTLVSKPSPTTPTSSSKHGIPYFDPQAKDKTPIPYIPAIVTNDLRCSLVETPSQVLSLHPRDIARWELKRGDRIEVVPTRRYDAVEIGCVRKI